MATYIKVAEPENLREELLPKVKPEASARAQGALLVEGRQGEQTLGREDELTQEDQGYDKAIIKSEIARFEKIVAEIDRAMEANGKTHEAQKAAADSTSWSMFAKPDMTTEDAALKSANDANLDLEARVSNILALLKSMAKDARIEGYDEAPGFEGDPRSLSGRVFNTATPACRSAKDGEVIRATAPSSCSIM